MPLCERRTVPTSDGDEVSAAAIASRPCRFARAPAAAAAAAAATETRPLRNVWGAAPLLPATRGVHVHHAAGLQEVGSLAVVLRGTPPSPSQHPQPSPLPTFPSLQRSQPLRPSWPGALPREAQQAATAASLALSGATAALCVLLSMSRRLVEGKPLRLRQKRRRRHHQRQQGQQRQQQQRQPPSSPQSDLGVQGGCKTRATPVSMFHAALPGRRLRTLPPPPPTSPSAEGVLRQVDSPAFLSAARADLLRAGMVVGAVVAAAAACAETLRLRPAGSEGFPWPPSPSPSPGLSCAGLTLRVLGGRAAVSGRAVRVSRCDGEAALRAMRERGWVCSVGDLEVGLSVGGPDAQRERLSTLSATAESLERAWAVRTSLAELVAAAARPRPQPILQKHRTHDLQAELHVPAAVAPVFAELLLNEAGLSAAASLAVASCLEAYPAGREAEMGGAAAVARALRSPTPALLHLYFWHAGAMMPACTAGSDGVFRQVLACTAAAGPLALREEAGSSAAAALEHTPAGVAGYLSKRHVQRYVMPCAPSTELCGPSPEALPAPCSKGRGFHVEDAIARRAADGRRWGFEGKAEGR
eukprot:Rhum_TRINITY_DN11612_c0_g1::Rhum_TRINITY_DN11612_c0_g1_i1::g.45738::m.45738